VKLVRRPPVPRGRTRRLKEGEEESLLNACEYGRSPLLRSLIILAIETAMRRSELLSLRWENVDLKLRVAHLPLTKNGESRDVPLSRRAVQTLEVIHAGGVNDQQVFPVSGNAVRLAFEHLRARAGLLDFRFHDLRHEAISRLFEKGLNIAEVGAISGHRDLKMLQRYTHLRAADLAVRLDSPSWRNANQIGIYAHA
jgi:integrase